MIVSDILTRVKRTFGDESGVQVTDDDIIRWINDAQRQIAMQNEGLLEKTALSDAVKGQQEYSPPTDLLILQGLSYKSPDDSAYYKLKGLSWQQMNAYIDGFDGNAYDTATPIVYSLFANKLILFPSPDRNMVSGIKIFYNRKPTDVVSTTDTPDLPLLYHDVIVKHCLQQAYELDENFDAAQLKGTQMDADVAMLNGALVWQQQDMYPTITIRPEDEF